MQYAETSKNANLPGNRFVQTRPMQHSEAITNTNWPSNKLVETQAIHKIHRDQPCKYSQWYLWMWRNGSRIQIKLCKTSSTEWGHT